MAYVINCVYVEIRLSQGGLHVLGQTYPSYYTNKENKKNKLDQALTAMLTIWQTLQLVLKFWYRKGSLQLVYPG